MSHRIYESHNLNRGSEIAQAENYSMAVRIAAALSAQLPNARYTVDNGEVDRRVVYAEGTVASDVFYGWCETCGHRIERDTLTRNAPWVHRATGLVEGPADEDTPKHNAEKEN